MKGLYCWTKDGPDDWWARVEVRQGEWTDMSKADYEAQKVEPHFLALPDVESWRGSAPAG